MRRADGRWCAGWFSHPESPGFRPGLLVVCFIQAYTSQMPPTAGSLHRPEPLAYFLTWTTYGSWLPGDARGWTDDRGVIREANPRLARMAGGLMHGQRVVLTFAERRSVAEAIHGQCDFRGWILHAVNCRTTHVHVVVSATEFSPNALLGCLKARCSRHLSRGTEGPRTWWTRGGSMRRIYDTQALEDVIAYVVECQDKPRM
jgi:hypothetical protein